MCLKKVAKTVFVRLFSSRIGRKILLIMLPEFKDECFEVLGRYYNDRSTFLSVDVPEKVDSFEDLIFLFWSSPLNRGVARLDLDEASYIYKLLRSLKRPSCVEIGRFKGGSTFIIASAMDGNLVSIDYHVKMMLVDEGKTYDDVLASALKKAGLDNRVRLDVGDSTTYDNSSMALDFIFIDGDHSYEGVKKDYEHWIGAVKNGGHILFHDAVDPREFTTFHSEVKRLMLELRSDNRVFPAGEAGSIAHYIKK